MVQRVASNTFFTTIDLKSAYHQIALKKQDWPLTAFEASSKLYEFLRLLFGCTNAVPIFQCTMDSLISKNSLVRTYAYLDDIIIGGRTQEEHDNNVQRFKKVAENIGLQFNYSKCRFSQTQIIFLGHVIENVSMRLIPAVMKHYLTYQSHRPLKSSITLSVYSHIMQSG